MLNTVILHGRLTRDCEVRMSQGGLAVVNFSLAVEDRVKSGERWDSYTNYIDCVAFGKRGEAFDKYHSKGKWALIRGRLRHERWDDKESGKARSRIKVIVDDWTFADSSSGTSEDGQSSDEFEPDQVPF